MFAQLSKTYHPILSTMARFIISQHQQMIPYTPEFSQEKCPHVMAIIG